MPVKRMTMTGVAFKIAAEWAVAHRLTHRESAVMLMVAKLHQEGKSATASALRLALQLNYSHPFVTKLIKKGLIKKVGWNAYTLA